jgi:(p)ppGpp synthase/HD superfamily hydrolase
LPAQLTARFAEALAYAFGVHSAQRRKGSGVPYVAHLMSVAAIALEHEDQGGEAMRAEITRRFGPTVAEIVDGCTDAETIPKPPWRDRKEKFLARLPLASRSVHLVCAADKLHNARSLVEDHRVLGDKLWQRFNGGKEGTLWYYRGIVTALEAASPGPLVDQLARTVAELERAAALSKPE